MSADFVLQLILAVCAGAGVYAAIKADLTRAILTAEHAQKEAERAQSRVTDHIDNHAAFGR